MSIIHRTTMKPTKLELLEPWLPTQPWYAGEGERPTLAKAGGFRLDDPKGEVGIEFMVVIDDSGDEPIAYHIPLTYRGAPIEGADDALIGMSEHGVLGKRWIYDGTHDPVLAAQLLALLQGDAEPQAQSVSDTPDPSVLSSFAASGGRASVKSSTTAHGREGTELRLELTIDGEVVTEPAGPAQELIIRVTRVLRPGGPASGAAEAGTADAGAAEAGTAEPLGHVTAGWSLPESTESRGAFAVVLGS
ncbi:1,4-alpha-glucan branching protein [Streptomyces sp. NPDC046805]|uniref:maltokinase N-terminal cap-like domain-containing protein n=1 Tax=Streptomyces sp. NPDC046805 TaxID=3155134 RepID=UPI0033C593A5